MDVRIPIGSPPGKSLPKSVTLAVDTEFVGTHTLTVQATTRLDEHTLVVQVYRSAHIPDLPAGFDQEHYLPITPEKYGRFCAHIIIRPTKLLAPDLSPARMMLDLHGGGGMEVMSRTQDLSLVDPFPSWEPANLKWNKRKGEWELPSVTLCLVGHYLRADFCRIFGRAWWESLRPQASPWQSSKRVDIAVRSRKLLGFVGQTGKRTITEPVLEHIRAGDDVFGVRLRTRDTMLPYGPASLDSLSQSFLGFGKCDMLTEEEKRDMLTTFRTRTADAYGYAMVDAVNTLLVYEAMEAKHREIAEAFGLQ